MVGKPMPGQDRDTEAERTGNEGDSAPVRGGEFLRVSLDKRQAPQATAARRRRNRVAVLAKTLETEIIPRLLLAHRKNVTAAYIDSGPGSGPGAEDVATLISLAMKADLPGALAYLEGLRARSMSLDRIYLDLLSPVARRLGVMWEEDECDFTTVTIALSCLHQVVREYSPAFMLRAIRAEPDRRVLLAPAPGEQHSFGMLVVEQFFRGAGWDVWSGAGVERHEILEAAQRVWFGVAGFSLACEDHLSGLAMLIRDVRRISRNAGVGILVGGALFVDRPDLVSLVGADATAADGRQATLQAETMLALLGRDT
ncbi:cobalamin B12-binding domain-containing protein [Roseomonas rosulenta]|uniref:cobalamin B12-binding domain-containing protein n=1 Tax=Roseomonas rosulenta TaxID=2748667 RepID=UPI0018DF040A|nr:cobalamin B12-binding domain-containing protein [Roseomonas rosulenta]